MQPPCRGTKVSFFESLATSERRCSQPLALSSSSPKAVVFYYAFPSQQAKSRVPVYWCFICTLHSYTCRRWNTVELKEDKQKQMLNHMNSNTKIIRHEQNQTDKRQVTHTTVPACWLRKDFITWVTLLLLKWYLKRLRLTSQANLNLNVEQQARTLPLPFRKSLALQTGSDIYQHVRQDDVKIKVPYRNSK